MKKATFLYCLGAFFGLLIVFSAQAVKAEAVKNGQQDSQLNFSSLQAKVGVGLQYSVDRLTKKLNFITTKDKSLPLNFLAGSQSNSKAVANQFMQEYGQYFGLKNSAEELKVIQEQKDQLGSSHIRYNQQYKAVPVFGGQLIVHLGQDLAVSSANGRVVPGISIDVLPKLSAEEAINRAKEYWKKQFNLETAEVLKSNLYIFNKGLIENKPDNKNYLVWQVELYNEKPQGHEYYFINALTGDLVYQITGIQTLDRRIYDCSYGDGYCYLDGYSAYYNYTFGRSEGQSARGANPTLWAFGLQDTDNLYNYIGNLSNYYSTKFSRNGANNGGGIGDGSEIYPTASTVGFTFIDYFLLEYDSCPNAFFNGANSLHFCQEYPTVDITGHEYAHAVNHFSILDGSGNPAGLTYTYESGALNENNSDVFGEALEYYYEGSNNWEIGEDLPDGASRSMADPMKYTYDLGSGAVSYPDRFNSEGFYCGDGDNGGVHINSSVPNHAAYLIAMGGTFNGCTVNGLGREKEEAIFYRAETVYYTTSTDFNGAYYDLIGSCNDLYSASDCLEVTKALQAVEMDQAGKCSGETATAPEACTSPTVASVSSTNANGIFGAGYTVNIFITFSKAVTSTGDVTVALETGSTDRSCAFTITDLPSGSCTYTVQTGDASADLAAISVSGTITDQYGNVLTNTTPATNLSANKDIVIDTASPTVSLAINSGATYAVLGTDICRFG